MNNWLSAETPYGAVAHQVRPDGLENWEGYIRVRAIGKPTMTQKSKHTKASAVDYLNRFCPTLLAGFNRAAKFQSCESIVIRATFATPDASLWGQRYQAKPDATNIQKGVEDALIIDDSQNDAACFRTWGSQDSIHVTLMGVNY